MLNIFIIGAGPFGREIENWLEAMPGFGTEWTIAGYLHAGEHSLTPEITDYKVIGNWEDYAFTENDRVVLGIASGEWKQRIWNSLQGKVRFFTVIHPSSIIGKFTHIGEGCVICPFCGISTHVSIGNGVSINGGTQIGHDAEIGDFTSIMAHCDINGYARIGKSVYMGCQSQIVPHKTIADRIQIAAGSVVMRSFKTEGITIGGNPAVKLLDASAEN